MKRLRHLDDFVIRASPKAVTATTTKKPAKRSIPPQLSSAVPAATDLTNFTEVDLVVLLQRLVTGEVANPDGALLKALLGCDEQPVPEEDQEARAALAAHIDYFRFRAIKTYLEPGLVDGRLYDKETMPGSFARLADRVRSERRIPLFSSTPV